MHGSHEFPSARISSLEAFPDGLSGLVLLPGVIIGLSNDGILEATLVKTMVVVEPADPLSIEELLAADLAMMFTRWLDIGCTNVVVCHQ